MKHFLKIACIILCATSVLSCRTKTQATTISKVNRVDLRADVIGKEVQFVDVRTPEEYEAGHIDDAVNYNIIDSEIFIKQIASLDKTAPVYLYCKMGGRSSRAAELLKEKGFTQIFDYSGGYNDWVSQ